MLPQPPLKAFIVYAKEDREITEELKKWLYSFVRDNELRIWYDDHVLPGERWHEEVMKELQSADIVLLILSVDFFNSTYILDSELPMALDRHKRGDTHVIPILARDYSLGEHKEILSFQVVPDSTKSIAHWGHNRDNAFKIIKEAIRRVIDKILLKEMASLSPQIFTSIDLKNIEFLQIHQIVNRVEAIFTLLKKTLKKEFVIAMNAFIEGLREQGSEVKERFLWLSSQYSLNQNILSSYIEDKSTQDLINLLFDIKYIYIDMYFKVIPQGYTEKSNRIYANTEKYNLYYEDVTNLLREYKAKKDEWDHSKLSESAYLSLRFFTFSIIEKLTKKMIMVQDKNSDAYFLRGLMRDEMEAYEDAIRDYGIALNQNPPNSDELYYNMTISYGKFGDKKNALACIKNIKNKNTFARFDELLSTIKRMP